jgi:hypothetical protein
MHTGEIFAESSRAAAPKFTLLEQNIEAAIVAELVAAGVARPRPLAQLVLASADGVARKATLAAEIGPAVRLLVERLVRPELPRR